ncbi:hypothetical protein M407DRAFT_27910 [Tulasnella calospora MUT 4182]|uniref:Uncharacterized protein n=1 Tax=Tulasnella calospora MUT 4182 TaxID=1051891 RepID=A0A0C3KMI4_9AGAM|nr:hypothetical protein M407DRAFT_27910 [Tulasnella calospora MUT 4182]
MAKIENFWTTSNDYDEPPAPAPPAPANLPPKPPTSDEPPKKESPPAPPPKTLVEFPALSLTKQTQQEETPPRKCTFTETAARPVPALFNAPQGGSRPLWKAAENVTDYFVGKRRTTKPAPRRQQVVDRGGAENPENNNNLDAPPPGAFPVNIAEVHAPESEDNEADIDAALKATPIVESLAYVYKQSDNFLSWQNAHQIGFEIAPEKAYSTAT